jgi:hypothetical protein
MRCGGGEEGPRAPRAGPWRPLPPPWQWAGPTHDRRPAPLSMPNSRAAPDAGGLLLPTPGPDPPSLAAAHGQQRRPWLALVRRRHAARPAASSPQTDLSLKLCCCSPCSPSGRTPVGSRCVPLQWRARRAPRHTIPPAAHLCRPRTGCQTGSPKARPATRPAQGCSAKCPRRPRPTERPAARGRAIASAPSAPATAPARLRLPRARARPGVRACTPGPAPALARGAPGDIPNQCPALPRPPPRPRPHPRRPRPHPRNRRGRGRRARMRPPGRAAPTCASLRTPMPPARSPRPTPLRPCFASVPMHLPSCLCRRCFLGIRIPQLPPARAPCLRGGRGAAPAAHRPPAARCGHSRCRRQVIAHVV